VITPSSTASVIPEGRKSAKIGNFGRRPVAGDPDRHQPRRRRSLGWRCVLGLLAAPGETKFAFTSCRRATTETDAPGSSVSATICRLSEAGQERRRARSFAAVSPPLLTSAPHYRSCPSSSSWTPSILISTSSRSSSAGHRPARRPSPTVTVVLSSVAEDKPVAEIRRPVPKSPATLGSAAATQAGSGHGQRVCQRSRR
jgi:hypothetical protein